MAATLLLVALRVAAQAYPEPSSKSTEPTVTNQNTTEERTNPATPTHSMDPGLTATGTVVTWNDDEVVIKTSTGPTHIKILPATLGLRTFTAGQSVSVDFSRNEQGVLLAKQIRSAGPIAAEEPVPVGATADTTAGQTPESLDPPVTGAAAMPSTASNSPLLALLGLLALGGAAALRRG